MNEPANIQAQPITWRQKVDAWKKQAGNQLKDSLPTFWEILEMALASDQTILARIAAEPSYDAAKTFQKNIEPQDGVEYAWVWAFAKDQYARLESICKGVDEKANDILKYLGGGAGLLTLAVLANVTARNYYVFLLAVPSLVLALISIAFAAKARRPIKTLVPPDVKGAFEYASYYKKESTAMAAFIGQWHFACEGLRLVTEAKAARVKVATSFYVWAISSLALAFIAALILAATTTMVG